MLLVLTAIITFASGIVYASFFEWTLHRYVMHRPLWFFMYPYIAHHKTHHKIYEADETYHYSPERLISQSKKYGLKVDPSDIKITMAWWNGPVLIFGSPLPFYCIAYALMSYGYTAIAWTIVATSIFTSACYYGAYEYLHHCMHLPKKLRLEMRRFFILLNGHHTLHHRFKGTNFNVVLPLADYILGTLLTRSKIRFKQVRGPSVPDLQPIAI